jgi:hypothetical protein
MDLTGITFGLPEVAGVVTFFLICLGVFAMVKRSTYKNSRGDLRADSRYQSKFKGSLDVNGQKLNIRGIDLNESGALITSRVPVASDSRVFLHISSHGLMGWAKVRHCTRSGMFGYRLGLEFRGSLMRSRDGNWQFASVKRIH